MECLAVGRHLLRRAQASSLPSCRPYLPPASICPRYVFSTSSRRIDSHKQPNPPTHDASSQTSDQSQAYPLSGFYTMVLESRPYYKGQISTARAAAMRSGDKPLTASMEEEKTPQERMAIVFGGRLAGPGRSSRYNPGETPPETQWDTINGVAVPPRPEEPDNCCMSGCANCVWDDFRDEMEEWAGRVSQAKAKGGPSKATADMPATPRAEVGSASQSMDDDGVGSNAAWTGPTQEDDLFGNIPVGIKEFMKIEKKLRTKRQQAEAP